MFAFLSIIPAFCAAREFPALNLHTFCDGNWSRKYNNETNPYKFTMKLTDIAVDENNNNISYFTGEYEENTIKIKVTSNTTCTVEAFDMTFDMTFKLADFGVAYADTIVQNTTHISIVIFSTYSFEMTVTQKGSDEIHYMGFFKKASSNYTWKDFVIPSSIAIIVYLIGMFICKNMM